MSVLLFLPLGVLALKKYLLIPRGVVKRGGNLSRLIDFLAIFLILLLGLYPVFLDR